MQNAKLQFEVARGWSYFTALLVITFVAFWPSYFAPGIANSSRYVHFHAATAAAWMAMLIIQPWLIRTYRFDIHRALGRVAFILVPLVLAGMLLLANFRIRSVPESDFPGQTYVLYLQISLAAVFVTSFILAMVYRKNAELHARFMICTGLTLIDPVFARLFYWIHPNSFQLHQWLTFGLTDAILLLIIFAERRNTSARWALPVMLFVFVAAQLPALLWLTNSEMWQAFARWFQSIPLT